MTPESRQMLAGRFALDSRIGAGNYAEVFRATDTQTGELVAVKTLRAEHVSEAQTLSLFENEGKAGSAISHTNVVKVSSHGEYDGTHFIVMELVKGISLRRRLKLAGRLDAGESLRIMIGVLRGLEAIHDAGYVHRDIKPQNILIDASGVPKITDFGITLCPGDARTCSGGLTLGTAAYIAPEQAAGQETGTQADLYSAGAVLFEMLTGEAPFPGDDPIEVMNQHLFESPRDPRTLSANISPALSAIVMRALAKEPASRFRSAQHMREALEMLQEESPRQATRGRYAPSRRIPWTMPLASSRQIPLRLANVPILATFVSALLLIVLFIVLILALVSTAVNASSSHSRISSFGPPSGNAGTSSPPGIAGPVRASSNAIAAPIPNWSASAAVGDPASTPTTTPQTMAAVIDVPANGQTPVADTGTSSPTGSSVGRQPNGSANAVNRGPASAQSSNQNSSAPQIGNNGKHHGSNRHAHD